MRDQSKTDTPKVEELSADDLDAVAGGYLKLGDIAGESVMSRTQKGSSLNREGDKNGDLIITMEN